MVGFLGTTMSASIHKVIGARIRLLRKHSGLSQEEVADAIKCDNATLSRYERGLNAPDGAQLVQLAALFKISPAEFLPGSADLERQELIDIRTQLIDMIFLMDDIDEVRKVLNFTISNRT